MKKTFIIIIALTICATLCACIDFTCSRCDGEGMITCPSCFEGWDDCYKCRNGKIYQECERCDGKGTDSWQAVWCENCDRTGRWLNPYSLQYVTCMQCNGDGRYYPDCKECTDGTVVEECPVCKGDYRKDCPNCESGRIPCPECVETNSN